jgi:DNA-directed RNA polymerase specialized sigma24 family protein
MAAPAFRVPNPHSTRLADPALREALLKFAKRRLPPGDVDDLVQNTLADALASASAPIEEAAFRRWVQGIARHKIADLYRSRGRQPPLDSEIEADVNDPGPATGDLAQWIERELPKTQDAKATLHWLLRESDGESLDEIARDAALPAPRVRQRVSRLRRHFQTRWLALGAAGLALLLGAGALFDLWQGTPVALPSITRETPTPLDRARALRQSALDKCAAAAYRECIAQLDEAKALDPIGETASAVIDARSAAARAQSTPTPMNPEPTPAPKALPKQFAPKHDKPTPKHDKPTLKQEMLPQKELPTQENSPFDLPTTGDLEQKTNRAPTKK